MGPLPSCYNRDMRAASLISDAAWVLLGLAVCIYAMRLRLWDAAGPGSGFLPFLAGLVIAGTGLGLLAREWAARPAGRPFWSDAAGRTRVALVIVALVAMALLMPRLGEAVEPAHLERVDPWWRGVDRISPEPRPREPVVERLPKSMPWPID